MRTARLEQETALQGLQQTLTTDLGRRRQELQNSLATAEADADQCFPPPFTTPSPHTLTCMHTHAPINK